MLVNINLGHMWLYSISLSFFQYVSDSDDICELQWWKVLLLSACVMEWPVYC